MPRTAAWMCMFTLGSGCIVGGGPTIALRTSGPLAVGWELNANLANVGVETGASGPIGLPGSTSYLAFTASHVVGNSSDGFSPRVALGGADDGDNLLVSASAFGYHFTDMGSCTRSVSWLATVQLGARVIGGHLELFLAPAIDAVFSGGPCT